MGFLKEIRKKIDTFFEKAKSVEDEIARLNKNVKLAATETLFIPIAGPLVLSVSAIAFTLKSYYSSTSVVDEVNNFFAEEKNKAQVKQLSPDNSSFVKVSSVTAQAKTENSTFENKIAPRSKSFLSSQLSGVLLANSIQKLFSPSNKTDQSTLIPEADRATRFLNRL